MASGLSFKSFGAKINVCAATITNWAKEHEDFLAAKKIGQVKLMAFMEELGRDAMTGRLEGFNATIWIFQMKNRFPEDWRDKHEVTAEVKPFAVKAPDGKTVVTLGVKDGADS